jgi:hypothetical protein
MEASIIHEVRGNNLLKQFPVALEEGDGMVGFGKAIVWLIGFGDRDNLG